MMPLQIHKYSAEYIRITFYHKRKMSTKNTKILIFIDQHTAHLKNINVLSNIMVISMPANHISQLQILDLGIIHAVKCNYRKFIQKTVAMIYGGLLQDASVWIWIYWTLWIA